MTANVKVTDECLWLSHISDRVIVDGLRSLEPGSRIWLRIDDAPILFERMATGKNLSATPGLKPVGATRQSWRNLYENRRGGAVTIAFLGSVEA